MAEEFTAKFKVDISDLKKNISEANKQIKLANATFKSETAGMTNWTKDADGLSKKLNQLKQVLSNQKTILSSYQTQLQKQQQAYDENGKRAEQLKAKLKELAEQGVSKTDEEYKKYEKSLKQVEKEQQNNGKACDDLKLAIINQQGAVNKTEADIVKYDKALSDLEKEQKQATEEANRQKTAYEQLQDTIDDQQTELNDLKKKYAEVVVEQGKDSDAAKQLQKDITNLSGELATNKTKLNEADKAADDFDQSLKDTGEGAEQAKGGLDSFKVALGDLVSQAIQAAVQALKDMAKATYEAWEAFDQGADNIIALTGKTGEEAQQLTEVYKNLGKSVKADFSDIGTAVGEVSTRFDLAGDELEDVAGKFLKFADVNNLDVKSSIDNVQSAMAAFGVSTENTSDFLDMLNVASQQSGTDINTLTNALVSNAPALSELGYNASDSAMFVAQLAKNGVDVSATMAGMKKALANAAKEGKPLDTTMERVENSIAKAGTSTQATQRAMELFGNKAGPAIASAIRDGRLSFQDFGAELTDFSGNLETTYDSMRGANDSVAVAMQALKISAAELFQDILDKHGEDLKRLIENFTTDLLPKIFDGLEWLIDNLPGIIKTASKIDSVINPFKQIITMVQDVVNGFGEWKQQLEVFWTDITTKASDTWNSVVSVWGTVKDWFTKNVIQPVQKFFNNLWNNISQFAKNTWEKIKNVWNVVSNWFNNVVIAPVTRFFSEMWQIISTLAKGCWEIIKRAWEIVSGWFNVNVIQPVQKFFTDLWEKVSKFASDAWEKIKEVWNVVSTWFDTTIIQPVQRYFSGMWDKLKQGASDAWDGIKSVFSNVTTWFRDKFTEAWNAVKNVFSAGGSAFETIKDGISTTFKTVVNRLISGINSVISVPFNAINSALDKIRNVKILGISPFSGLGSISVPSIPYLAQGGILKKGQVGLLEGSGAEAVVPLSQNKKWVKAVASEMINQIGQRPNVNTNTVKNSNTTFNQYINSPRTPTRIELYRQTKNLLALAQGGMI